MTRWWIIDYTAPGASRTSPEGLADGIRRAGREHPDHLLLLGCDAQTAIGVRNSVEAFGREVKIHTLLKPRLDAFDQAPEHWLQLCLQRLLQKNGAQSVTVFPEPQPGKTSPASVFLSGIQGEGAVFEGPGQSFPERRSPGKTSPAKPSLAFVSPLPPSKTGIAAYSAELLPYLAAHYDLTLVVEKASPQLPGLLQGFPRITADAFSRRAAGFDRIVYQIGNSFFHSWQFDLVRQYPGLVVLHDYYLYDALWWEEKAGVRPRGLRYRLYADHGYGAVLELDLPGRGRGPEHYPVNGGIVNEAAGLVVHSQHARRLHRRWYPDAPDGDVHVIPHLRKPPQETDRAHARRALGINDEALVIASFGNMNPKKGVDRIVEAFFNADPGPSRETLLVFAGAGHAGEYGENIRKRIRAHPRGARVRITGYLPDETYRAWLRAADIAVQLRTTTRGESSGAVLDAMSHGLPLITNAHGSSGEFPGHAVCMLPEDPSADSIRSALEGLCASRKARSRLEENARSWIRRHHDPVIVAERYRQAVEKSLEHPLMQQKRWLDRLAAAAENRCPTREQLENISASMQQLRLLRQKRPPTLFIDVSILAWHDQKTGIERVTREMAVQLLKNPPPGYRSELIRWTGNDFYLAVDYAARLLGLADAPAPNRPIEAGAGDIYLTLEWAPPVLWKADGVFREMKARGVRFCFTVHDLLPMFLPECFPAGTEEKMRDWFHRIAHLADGLICVSAHVAETVNAGLDRLDLSRRPGVAWFHPGADFSRPPGGTPGFRERRMLKKIDAAPSPRLLVVGTLEPRKGHAQVLDAAERLWEQNQPFTLVFAGKQGRGVRPLVARLKKHPQKNRRLFWCNAASDAFLRELYNRADLLVAASSGEGFGLPLIEAAHYGLPILARDIPVFREVAGGYARYFRARNSTHLAGEMAAWIRDWRAGGTTPAVLLSYNSWADSAGQLKTAMFQSFASSSTRKGEKRHAKSERAGSGPAAGPATGSSAGSGAAVL